MGQGSPKQKRKPLTRRPTKPKIVSNYDHIFTLKLHSCFLVTPELGTNLTPVLLTVLAPWKRNDKPFDHGEDQDYEARSD